MSSVELKRWLHLLNDMQNQNPDLPETASDFDLVLLACDLVALVRQKIANTISLEVEASQSVTVQLPENTFRQALLNLVLNAAEGLDSHASGHICIKIYQTASAVTIQVLDNGKGFSPQRLNCNIRPLRNRRQAETGLSMVQRFVNTLGGDIKLSNRLEGGACVTLLLPAECIVEVTTQP